VGRLNRRGLFRGAASENKETNAEDDDQQSQNELNSFHKRAIRDSGPGLVAISTSEL